LKREHVFGDATIVEVEGCENGYAEESRTPWPLVSRRLVRGQSSPCGNSA
jgi:hypothetical protein